MVCECTNCKKIFERDGTKPKYQTNFYCSKECQSSHRYPKNELTCPICNNIFHRKTSHIKKAKDVNNMTCSKKCCYELKKITMSGEKNHQYGLVGDLNSSWKSDTRLSHYGYILIRDINHPFRGEDDFLFEHRYIAEQFLLEEKFAVIKDGKQYLSPECAVHHIDFNRTNNSVENLYIFESHAMHTLFHNIYPNRVKSIEEFEVYYKDKYINKILNYDWLHKAYVEYGLSVRKLSEHFNIPYKSIENQIKKFKLNKNDNHVNYLLSELEKFQINPN